MNDVTIRVPRVARLYAAAFGVAWCAFLLDAFVATVGAGSPAAVIPLALLAFGLTLAFRLVTVSVKATTDELFVRNFLSTKRLPKGLIEGFCISSRTTRNGGKGITALLGDDTVLELNVTGRPALTVRGQDKLQTQLHELRHWLAP